MDFQSFKLELQRRLEGWVPIMVWNSDKKIWENSKRYLPRVIEYKDKVSQDLQATPNYLRLSIREKDVPTPHNGSYQGELNGNQES